MKSKTRYKGLSTKYLSLIFVFLLLCVCGAAVVWGFSWSFDHEDEITHHSGPVKLIEEDPMPSELVAQYLVEDSVKTVRRKQLKASMTNVITNYRKRFRQQHFTGYFMTDLDSDGLPELWVKVGNYRDNSKLELYYPLADGTLLKSEVNAAPGQYYIGDNYLIQVVESGPGYMDVNRITINNGTMKVVNESGIDIYGDANAKLPEFAEHAIRDSSFLNLTELNRALLL